MTKLKITNDLKKIIQEENENWTKIFEQELSKNSKSDFSSFWWEDYYKKLTGHINNLLSNNDDPYVLEAGCGSGKASILLGKKIRRTLLDISDVALEFSERLSEKFGAENIDFVQGNIFDLPQKNNQYDFVWNIGVVEHYNSQQIQQIISEMIRVTKKNGIVAIAIPNFYSGPIIKAWLLTFPLFKLIPGYRLGTENHYSIKLIKYLFQKAAKRENISLSNIHIDYFGNPLPMETPKLFLKTIGGLIDFFFPKNRFLILISSQIQEKSL